MHNTGRDALGAASVAVDAAELRRGADRNESCAGAPTLALVGAGREDRDLDRLVVPSLPPSLRPAHVSRQGVFGFRSTRFGVPLDEYGRNVFVDTFGSAYGPGWQRENSFLTHAPGGGFCYGFYAHGGRGVGNGTRYRATVIGPGVTPDVMWQGPPPAAYDATADSEANAHQRSVLGTDPRCTVN